MFVEYCEDKTNGLYSYPLDCSKFYNCAHGDTHVMSCYEGTYWSPPLNNCDWITSVDCGSRPEPSGKYNAVLN